MPGTKPRKTGRRNRASSGLEGIDSTGFARMASPERTQTGMKHHRAGPRGRPHAAVMLALALTAGVMAADKPVEIHDRLAATSADDRRVALTLDACSGGYDADLIEILVRNRIPATIFATRRWLDANPLGRATLKAHLDLFDIEDHGENHVPAVIGAGRKVYGIPGEPDIVHLRREVQGGAAAVADLTGAPPPNTTRPPPTRSAAWAIASPASRSMPMPGPRCRRRRSRSDCGTCGRVT